MNFEITGKLIEIYPVTVVSDKFKKREFVIETSVSRNGFDFTDYIKFQLIQDKCNLPDNFKTGETVRVAFNLRGRRWEKDGTISYFTNLEAWKMDKVSGSETSEDVPFPDESDFTEPAGELDDLPF